jgi:class 3 adenylate cyclase
MLDHRRKIEDSERDRQIKLARFQEQERLLHDILPLEIANRIIQGETTIAEQNENVSLFFSDIVGFTTISQTIEPDLLVHELNIIFQEYDRIAKQYSIEKIKTIGDAYMAVSGINESIEHPHYNIAMFAIDVIDRLKKLELGRNKFKIRVGLHVGKVISGVIGGYKFSYDIWGDTVNIASRMESHSEPGRIHITEQFAKSIEHYPEFSVITRGEITVKGKGTMKTYWLEKKK